MKICNDISVTEPVLWQNCLDFPRLVKSPGEIRAQLAFETAQRINLETLENSYNRASLSRQNTYSRAQLDEFASYLGGTVRKDKHELIDFIKNKIKEIFLYTSENVHN